MGCCMEKRRDDCNTDQRTELHYNIPLTGVRIIVCLRSRIGSAIRQISASCETGNVAPFRHHSPIMGEIAYIYRAICSGASVRLVVSFCVDVALMPFCWIRSVAATAWQRPGEFSAMACQGIQQGTGNYDAGGEQDGIETDLQHQPGASGNR